MKPDVSRNQLGYTVAMVVDNEPHQLASLIRGITLYGYHYISFSSLKEVSQLLDNPSGKTVDVLLVNTTRHDDPQFVQLDLFLKYSVSLPVIVITGLDSAKQTASLSRQGVTFLPRPFDPAVLHHYIQQAIHSFAH